MWPARNKNPIITQMQNSTVIVLVFLAVAGVVIVLLGTLLARSVSSHHRTIKQGEHLQRYFGRGVHARHKLLPRNENKSEVVLPVRTYWHGAFGRKQHASVMSFLALHPRLRLWLLLDTDTIQLNSLQNPWIRSLARTSRVKAIPYQTDRRRSDDNLPAKADVVRYTDLYRYGGLWFDLDVVWMKNVQPLIDGVTPWGYPWGRESSNGLNNGVLYCPQGHPAMLSVLQVVDSCRHTALPVARHMVKQPAFAAQPIEYFDPSWDAPHGAFSFADFFRARRDTPLSASFFPDCYAYHWHNQWDAPIDKDSWFAWFESQNYARLKWSPVVSGKAQAKP